MSIETIIERLDRIEQAVTIGQKEVLTLPECCILTGYSQQHMYRLTSTRAIPHYRKGGKVFFRKGEVEQWLTGTRIRTNEERKRRQRDTYNTTN